MLAYPITCAGPLPRMLWTLLLLAVSLKAQNQSWDSLRCTEGEISVPRGSHVAMACNISSPFREVAIELTAHGRTKPIFKCLKDQVPPKTCSKDSWQLQIEGHQAQLVITDVQDIHAGQYWWNLLGLQRNVKKFTLKVTEPQDQKEAEGQKLFLFSGSQDLAADNQEPESLKVNAGPPSAERTDVIFITVIIVVVIIGIGAFVWYKRSHSWKLNRVLMPVLSHRSPASPDSLYLALP